MNTSFMNRINRGIGRILSEGVVLDVILTKENHCSYLLTTTLYGKCIEFTPK